MSVILAADEVPFEAALARSPVMILWTEIGSLNRCHPLHKSVILAADEVPFEAALARSPVMILWTEIGSLNRDSPMKSKPLS